MHRLDLSTTEKFYARNPVRVTYVRISNRTSHALSAFAFTLIATVALLVLGAMLGGCAKGIEDRETGRNVQPVVNDDPIACTASSARYPTTADDFSDAHLLYGHRGFLDAYQNVKHLGRDIVYAEGMAIHPMACGTIRFYGPANGYGTLAVVIEHEIDAPLQATNGEGQTSNVTRFMSIYGHLRDSQMENGQNKLSWKIGDTVTPDEVIGYIQSDALNGDGPEHLHSGIRLQSAAQAKASDSAWFRGYDTAGQGEYKKYYADPAVFITDLIAMVGTDSQGDPGNQAMPLTVNRHPIGTLLAQQGDGSLWLVVEGDTVVNVTNAKTLPKKCAVKVTDQEIACYWQTSTHPTIRYLDSKTIKFDGEPQVYQMYPSAAPIAYRTFLSYDSFLSWGFADADIEHRTLVSKSTTLGTMTDEGLVGFIPGALVKGNGQSEVAVADQHGVRRPLFNWDVFTQLGYDPTCIYGIETSTLDVVAGPRSDDLITLADTVECSANGQNQVCTPGTTVPCGCAGNKPGTQSCDSAGKKYGECVCQGGGGGNPVMCGSYVVGAVVDSPCCPDLSIGHQICQDDGVFSDCFDCVPTQGAGGSAGSSGQNDAGAGGSSEGFGGSSGSSGTGGNQGTEAGPDDVLVRIEYIGLPDFAQMPKHVDAWYAGHVWSTVVGCYSASAKDMVCEFQVAHASLLEFQVSVGANRFWGDTSGLAPAPCIPASQTMIMNDSAMSILGTVKLFVDNQPFAFVLKDNGKDDPNDNGASCGAAEHPYFNAYVAALP